MMTSYPRPIEFDEIQVEDTVRWTRRSKSTFDGEPVWMNCRQGVVLELQQRGLMFVDDPIPVYNCADGDTWELLDRPEPVHQPWSPWWDDETQTGWVRTDLPAPKSGANYAQVSGDSINSRTLEIGFAPDQEVIDRLVPYTGQDKVFANKPLALDDLNSAEYGATVRDNAGQIWRKSGRVWELLVGDPGQIPARGPKRLIADLGPITRVGGVADKSKTLTHDDLDWAESGSAVVDGSGQEWIKSGGRAPLWSLDGANGPVRASVDLIAEFGPITPSTTPPATPKPQSMTTGDLCKAKVGSVVLDSNGLKWRLDLDGWFRCVDPDALVPGQLSSTHLFREFGPITWVHMA